MQHPSLSPVPRVPGPYFPLYEGFGASRLAVARLLRPHRTLAPLKRGGSTASLLICRPLHGLLIQAGDCPRKFGTASDFMKLARLDFIE